MAEGRGRGRRPGEGATFPNGDMGKLDRAIAWFHVRHLEVSEGDVARFLGISARTIQRALGETPWTVYVAVVIARIDAGWLP